MCMCLDFVKHVRAAKIEFRESKLNWTSGLWCATISAMVRYASHKLIMGNKETKPPDKPNNAQNAMVRTNDPEIVLSCLTVVNYLVVFSIRGIQH